MLRAMFLNAPMLQLPARLSGRTFARRQPPARVSPSTARRCSASSVATDFPALLPSAVGRGLRRRGQCLRGPSSRPAEGRRRRRSDIGLNLVYYWRRRSRSATRAASPRRRKPVVLPGRRASSNSDLPRQLSANLRDVTGIFVGLLLGVAMGARHALDPDHLAAVSVLTADAPSARRGAALGALWGVGHAARCSGPAWCWPRWHQSCRPRCVTPSSSRSP